MENIELWKRGYFARQAYRQRRVNRAFVTDYLKAFAIAFVLLPIGWIFAVGILSI